MPSTASIETFPEIVDETLVDRYALLYNTCPFLYLIREMGVELLAIEPGMRVLEVGIGTGLSLSHYPKDVDLVAIDPSAKMLATARQQARALDMRQVELFEVGAEELPFPDGGFDRVLANSVFSVVPDPVKAFAQVTRVTKPGGLACIISHFAGRTELQRLADHIFEPLTLSFLGYRMTTPRSIIENNPAWTIVDQREFGFQNFSTAYLLRRLR